MWILENEGEALAGKRLWLRPGRRYLFGRTVAEPGQLAIQGPGSERVSRKHVVIRVDAVENGHAEVTGSRSRVTIEDLGSKGGTKVNGQKYKSETCVLSQESNTLQMGSFPPLFRITWFPVVLSFSFTSNDLRSNPINRLRDSLEQLDVKLLSEYNIRLTTHVVSKKRNTPKGLQALINGRYIVTDGFVDAVTKAASSEPPSDEMATSSLERDFDANWPDAMLFLPPPGEEPTPAQPESFAPNSARADIFDGYTFVFYEQKQYDNLLATITNGKGKALLHAVEPGVTEVDDFIRYVKGVAGEKGLGEFEDGSEGKGVVVIRWLPLAHQYADWLEEFYRSISLRLDHRLIDQKDFLGAILANDASGLRRPLESASSPEDSQLRPPAGQEQQLIEVDEVEQPAPPPPKPTTRRRGRQPVKSRFAGFAISVDDDDIPDEAISTTASASGPAPMTNEESQEGLFVTQPTSQPDFEPEPEANQRSQSQRKRPTSSRPEPEDVMNRIAPTAAQAKRRRLEAGEDPLPRIEKSPTPPTQKTTRSKEVKIKQEKEIDVLEMARQHREEAEKRAQEEREELEAEPGDLDMTAIRRLHIQEVMPLRELPQERTREQDIADGRWNPAWNGRKNFKRFQQRGVAPGRGPQRIIVPLEEVKRKGFGIGDGYWLKDNDTSQRQKSKRQDDTQTQSGQEAEEEGVAEKTRAARKMVNKMLPVDSSDDDTMDDDFNRNNNNDQLDDDDDDDDPIPSGSRTRNIRASASTTQRSTASTRGQNQAQQKTAKRPAAAPPAAKRQPAKKAKTMSLDLSDDDDSDDGLRFRFGKR